jgi:hypothetical protein
MGSVQNYMEILYVVMIKAKIAWFIYCKNRYQHSNM